MDIIDDLEAEHERLDSILSGLDDDQWRSPSAADGWSIADVVLHLAQSDEFIDAPSVAPASDGSISRGGFAGSNVDELMDERVRSQRAEPSAVYERWERSRRHSIDFLRAAPPDEPIPWAAGPLRPRTLATTRLAEYWAHGLDVAGPLGAEFTDMPRLYHVAWLAHRSLPYSLSLRGEEPHPVYCSLVGPDGSQWELGPPDAPSRISGSGVAFCRVGAQRLAPDDSGLETSGPYGDSALRALRNYAA